MLKLGINVRRIALAPGETIRIERTEPIDRNQMKLPIR